MSSPFITHNSKVVYKNPWITVHEDEVTLPNGKPGIYGYLESKDSVLIVVVDKNDCIYLVKNYRYPTKSWGWELPGGGGDGEKTIIASQRELVEETGITASSWEILGKMYVCNGLMTEQMSVVLARDLTVGSPTSDEETFDGSGFFSLYEIDQMIHSGDIDDSQTLTGLYLGERWLKQRRIHE